MKVAWACRDTLDYWAVTGKCLFAARFLHATYKNEANLTGLRAFQNFTGPSGRCLKRKRVTLHVGDFNLLLKKPTGGTKNHADFGRAHRCAQGLIPTRCFDGGILRGYVQELMSKNRKET